MNACIPDITKYSTKNKEFDSKLSKCPVKMKRKKKLLANIWSISRKIRNNLNFFEKKNELYGYALDRRFESGE